MAEHPDGPSDETLIAYVRGRLSAPEADRIAEAAAVQPVVAAEIAVFRTLAEAFAAEAREPSPGELGWVRLSRAIDAGSASGKETARFPAWHLAATAAAAVLIWQVAAVPFLADRVQTEVGYAPASDDAAPGLSVVVAFVPVATEQTIRTLLQETDARISDGPGALGLWELTFENLAARDAGLERLRAASGIVESVQAR